MLKKITLLTALLCGLVALRATAQDELIKLSFEVRADYVREQLDGHKIEENSGFKGRFFNICLNGSINEQLSYSYRQRLNRINKNNTFFDATDWLNLTYRPNDRWGFSAGKLVVAMGGWEYDQTPIDTYFFSEFCSQVACYQWGAQVMHTLKGERDTFTLQASQSPSAAGRDLYAYGLQWSGRHGIFRPLYSVNMVEYAKGKFLNYIILGNRFELGRVTLDLDLTHRATDQHPFWLRNCTLFGKVKVEACEKLHLFAQASYDVNQTSTADLTVQPDTEITRLGGGLEYYPLKGGNRNLRLHATYCHSFGSNPSEIAVMQPKLSVVNVGLTWRMDILSFVHKLTHRD